MKRILFHNHNGEPRELSESFAFAHKYYLIQAGWIELKMVPQHGNFSSRSRDKTHQCGKSVKYSWQCGNACK